MSTTTTGLAASLRRVIDKPPQLTKRSWEDVAPDLEDYLSKQHEQEQGLPAGWNDVEPPKIQLGGDPSSGDPECGWMSGCAQLVIDTDVTQPLLFGVEQALGNAQSVAPSDFLQNTIGLLAQARTYVMDLS